MIPRYARPEMTAVWSDERKFELWLKVEIAVGDALADRAIDTIARAGHTGQIGDGKIFSFPLDSAMRIRTGETGDDAL